MYYLARLALSCLAIAMAASSSAQAQNVLPHQIRIIVPFPAGGTTDLLARHVAQGLGERLGVLVLVENRPGASGTIGAEVVAKAPADGATLLLTATHHVIHPSLRRHLPYDTRADFSAIALVATADNALVVGRDFPASNVSELIAMARAQPGKLSFGSSGVGGANHLSGELFKQMAGIDLTHIPYKGAAPAMSDLIGGHIPIMFDALPTVLPAVEAGNIRVLAVTGRTRMAALPNVPTLDEAGLAGFEAVSWFGLFMPQAHGNAAYATLVAAMQALLAAPATRERFAALGIAPGRLTGTEFAGFVDSEIGKWGAVVKAARVPQE